MPVANKIHIGVEVDNNTKATFSQITTDIGRMSATIQASVATTSTFMSQSMDKAANAMQAANVGTSAAITSTYNKMKNTVTKDVLDLRETFKRNEDAIVADFIFGSDKRQAEMIKEWEKRKKLAEYAIDLNKRVEQSSADVFRSLTGMELNQQKEKENTIKQTQRQTRSMEQLAKRFISIAAAIWLAQRAYRTLIDSAKLYEDMAKKGSAGALVKLDQQMGQIRVEIGSVIEAELATIATYLEENASNIQEQSRKLTQVVIGLTKIAGGIVSVVSNAIYAIVGAVTVGITSLLHGLMSLVNNTLMKIPGIPKAIKQGWADATDAVGGFVGTMAEFTKTAGKDTIGSLSMIADGAGDLIKSTVDSGVKYVSDKTKAANQKYKDDKAAMIQWIKDLQDKADQSTMDEYSYRQGKIAEEYLAAKKKLAEAEKVYKIDTSLVMLQWDQWYASESEKVDQDRHNKRVERINEIEQRQKEAYEAALIGAKTQGLTGKAPQRTPSGFIDISAQAYDGTTAIADKIEEMNKAYDAMIETGRFGEEELAQARINIETETVNQLKQLDYDLLQSRMSNIQQTTQMFTDFASSIVSIGQMMTETQLNNLEKETEAKYKSLDNAYKADTKYTKNKGKLEEQYANAKEKIAEEQGAKEKELRNKQKGWSTAQALISGAEATMNAWVQAMKLAYPFNLISGAAMTGVITAKTIAQIAAIQSQKFAAGGIVDGPRSGDQVSAQLNGGEMVLTNQQQSALWSMISSGSYKAQGDIVIGGDTIIVQGNMDKDAADRLSRNRNERIKILKEDIRELSYRGQLAYA